MDFPSTTPTPTLLGLPAEIILTICRYLTTPSFMQLTSTCQSLFRLATNSRDVLLHHLNRVPGIKLGLEDQSVTSQELWLLLRQRVSTHLYGAHFTADCHAKSFRSGELNPTASCLTDSISNINLSFVCRDSLEIRHFDAQCSPSGLTPSPYADGLGRVVKVVHFSHFISVLYAWQQPRSRSSLSKPTSSHQAVPPPLRERPFRVPTKSTEPSKRDRSDSSSSDEPKIRYHLIHYDVHNFDRPIFFTIKPPKSGKHSKPRSTDPHLIPIHLSVYNRLKCAIIWSESHLGLRKSNATIVTLYVSDKIPARFEEGTYTSFKIYPPRPPPPPPSNSSDHDPHRDTRQRYEEDQRYYSTVRPIATAFRQQGTLLSFYAAGGSVPYTTAQIDAANGATLSNTTLSRMENVVTTEEGECVRKETRFYGQHTFGSVDEQDFAAGGGVDNDCMHAFLHLAVLMNGPLYPYYGRNNRREAVSSRELAMCVLRERCSTPSEECWHYVDLDNVPPQPTRALRGWDSRVVARLWGWKPPVMSSMSGLDSIAVSKGGTRVAISYWDEVYIWALQPDVLCEEWGEAEANEENEGSDGDDTVDDDDDGGVIDDDGSAAGLNGHNGGSGAPSVASSKSTPVPERGMIRATKYYKIIKDRRLGDIVELKPIVIKLQGGAVARQMIWKRPQPDHYSESDSNSDVESSIVSKLEDDGTGQQNIDIKSKTANEHIEAFKELKSDKERKIYTEQIKQEAEEVMAEVSKLRIQGVDDALMQRVEDRAKEMVERLKAKVDAFSPSKDWGKNKLLEPVVEEVEEIEGDEDDQESTLVMKEPKLAAKADEDVSKVSNSANGAGQQQYSRDPAQGFPDAACVDKFQISQDDNRPGGAEDVRDVSSVETSNDSLNTGISHLIPASTRPPSTSVEHNSHLVTPLKISHDRVLHTVADVSDLAPELPEQRSANPPFALCKAFPAAEQNVAKANDDDEPEDSGLAPSQISLQRIERRNAKGKTPIRDPIVTASSSADNPPDRAAALPPSQSSKPASIIASDADEGSTRHSSPSDHPMREYERVRRKRVTEDELVILTDRGVQVWNFGVWGRGRRDCAWLEDFKEGDGAEEGEELNREISLALGGR